MPADFSNKIISLCIIYVYIHYIYISVKVRRIDGLKSTIRPKSPPHLDIASMPEDVRTKTHWEEPVASKRDMMWCDILRPPFFVAHCASFMSRWPLLRGGGGLHIRSWDRAHIWHIKCVGLATRLNRVYRHSGKRTDASARSTSERKTLCYIVRLSEIEKKMQIFCMNNSDKQTKLRLWIMNHHKFFLICVLKYHLQFWYSVIYNLFIKQLCNVIQYTIFWNIFCHQLQFSRR